MIDMTEMVLIERIEKRIYLIRGYKVMLDSDLAALYGVTTKVLVQAVKRNIKRFPVDFMFQLAKDEFLRSQKGVSNLRSQFVTSSYGGRRYLPYAFTEQGVAMLSSVLNSERAIQVNIQIMRTFSKLRRILESHKDMAKKIEELEGRYDSQFKVVFDAIRLLMKPPEKGIKKIGFQAIK
jgi:hypothetical protein